MPPQDLTLGSAYYQVTYSDRDMTIPGVMPMIYIGLNVLPNDDPPGGRLLLSRYRLAFLARLRH
jgi:hypothetical protein